MVVFGVEREHLADEVGLAFRGAKQVDDELAVVPDLVVFLVRKGGFVEPVQFGAQVCLYGLEDLGAVEPALEKLVVLLLAGSGRGGTGE